MKNKGIIVINKPAGWTSFDVVNKLKYKVKPLKVGHLGTLDPMATGVLLVTIGKATKLFDIMQEKRKTYIATFEFGFETDTLDNTGKETATCDNIPTLNEILGVLPKFIGKISQLPPKYSAKSINGVRAYDLARQNIEFELKPKEVDVYQIKLISYENNQLKLEIECGSGTYIRSIGRDIAYELNSLATMTNLVRTKIGYFDLKDCVNIEQINEDLDNQIISVNSVLQFENLNLTNIDKQKLLNGQTIQTGYQDGTYSIVDEDDVVALIKIKDFKAKMSLFLG